MMFRTTLSVYCFLVLLAPSMNSQQRNQYTYIWTPKSTDVGTSNSKDYLLLQALLKLCRSVDYQVSRGDNIDFIIRKELLVSQQYDRAFDLYLKRIEELNPTIPDLNRLTVGETVRLPSGPKYGATEIAPIIAPRQVYASTFDRMSRNAYDLQTADRAKIQHFAARSLGAYVTSSGTGNEAVLFNTIQKRGLVYPIDEASHPESRLAQMQVLDLVTTDATRVELDAVVASDSENLLPGMFPVSDSIPVTCPQPCIDCKATFKIPQGIDLTKARVLVEDTGVAPGLVDSNHLLAQSAGDNGADETPESHGTFVYSEITAPDASTVAKLFGLIPKENVYVTKAVQLQDGSEYFSMSAIMMGWQSFSNLMSNDSSAATTRIVNVSAFGEPVPDLTHPPAIPNDGHLLIVAAAGNDGSEIEPSLDAFPRLSNGSTPLIIAGALGTNGQPTTYTNWNPSYVHLFAPGDCVCGAPGQLNGTSQAAPLISTAAAILASANPNWNPRYVMWRLISTADHPPYLAGKAFGGTVNLGKALNPLILIEEVIASGALKLHTATSIAYDTNWKNAFQQAGVNTAQNQTLRLYSPQPTTGANVICFSSLEILYLTVIPVCVNPEGQIQFIEDGSTVSLTADRISDVILPMPSPTDTGSSLPNVTVAP